MESDQRVRQLTMIHSQQRREEHFKEQCGLPHFTATLSLQAGICGPSETSYLRDKLTEQT